MGNEHSAIPKEIIDNTEFEDAQRHQDILRDIHITDEMKELIKKIKIYSAFINIEYGDRINNKHFQPFSGDTVSISNVNSFTVVVPFTNRSNTFVLPIKKIEASYGDVEETTEVYREIVEIVETQILPTLNKLFSIK